MTNLEIQRAIEQDFDLKLLDFRELTSNLGVVNSVYSAKIKNTEVIIRCDKEFPKFENHYSKEVFVYDLLKDISIEVPKVIAYQKNPPTLNYPCVILTKIQNVPLSKLDLKDSRYTHLAMEMGKVLSEINTIKTRGFGFFAQEPTDLKFNYETIKDFYENEKDFQYLDKFKYAFDHKLINKEEHDILISAYSRTVEDTSDSVLVYGDYKPEHIFTNGKTLTGIIDAGGALSATKYHDIGRVILYLPEKCYDQFFSGYGQIDQGLAFSYAAIVAGRKIANKHKLGKSEKLDLRISNLKSLMKYLD